MPIDRDEGEMRKLPPDGFSREHKTGLPAAARILILVASVAAAGIYVGASSRVYRAFRYAQDFSPDNLTKAMQLEPLDAELHYRMGRYSLLAQDLPGAIRQLQQAIERNAYDARYWLDLSSAYLASGDMDGQQRALARALEVDPTTPEVVWETANYELVRGDTGKALQQFHNLVEHDSDFVPSVINVCWRATGDAKLIAEQVLPARPEADFDFIRFLLYQRRPDAAAEVWSRLISLKTRFPVQSAFPYFEYLIQSGRFSELSEAWAQLAAPNPEFRPYVPTQNLIVNPRFELELLYGGLDWRYSPQPGASVNIDVARGHTGSRSLSIAFDGTVEDSGVFQLVPVHRRSTYHFSGFMTSEDLETISPPRFSIIGLRAHTQYLLTDGVQGSTDWRKFGGQFTTGSDDDLLLIRIVRSPGKPLIRGRIWVDDLSLIAEE